ncbi:N-acetylmuramoyl-L-alanine amidase family protein, partial [Pygmaiobacter massiliensis]|uniref:N-acetylmuramoyl-L-alanine amidase family protein n=1 Tax=Pygmaiobacter massiliensis TaxID=1917873 RepID=UPI0035E3C73A
MKKILAWILSAAIMLSIASPVMSAETTNYPEMNLLEPTATPNNESITLELVAQTAETNLTYISGEWTNETIIVQLKVQNPSAESLCTFQMQQNNGERKTIEKECKISSSGIYTFLVANEKGETVGSNTLTVHIDSQSPKIEKLVLTDENQEGSLAIVAADEANGSGLASEPYSFDGGNTWSSSAQKQYSETQTLVPNTIAVRDNAGNISTWTEQTVIPVTNKAPSSSANVSKSEESVEDPALLKDSIESDGFKFDSGHWQYFLNGQYLTGWQTIGDGRYYFDLVTGYAAVGQVKIDGNSYYFNSNCVLQTGWQTIGGAKYYF